MNTQVTTFEDGVKNRLRGIVAELIPEDRYNELVRQAIVDFERSTLPSIVRTELTEMYKVKIREEFAKPEWCAKYGGINPEAGDALKAMLVELAPLMLAQMMSGAAQQMFFAYQSQIQNQRY
ncbi:MAG TPA: hypothetical protein VK149_12065 [Sideroxyarcus sp.]|nr:hypothetical protein [Sideroxyarcus sp.]